MSFCQRLCNERKRLGFKNQEDFANRIGISKTSQVNYETGKRSPNVEYLEAIKELGVDLPYLLTGIRSDENKTVEQSANYETLNKKRLEKSFDELSPTQQADILRQIEEKKQLNACVRELSELKAKQA